MRIYAEWMIDGVFDNGFFASWDEYHSFMFSPEIELILVREC